MVGFSIFANEDVHGSGCSRPWPFCFVCLGESNLDTDWPVHTCHDCDPMAHKNMTLPYKSSMLRITISESITSDLWNLFTTSVGCLVGRFSLLEGYTNQFAD